METLSPVEGTRTVFLTEIEGLYLINTPLNTDERGFFRTIAEFDEIELATGLPFRAWQFNHSRSNTGVLRGLHAENWQKLVTVGSGKTLCVLVDIRPESPTFLKIEYIHLGNGEQTQGNSLFINSGIANSFFVIEGPLDYFYIVDALYRYRDTSKDLAIDPFDPDLNIKWPITQQFLLENKLISERDLSIHLGGKAQPLSVVLGKLVK